jgi:hypothetical protein
MFFCRYAAGIDENGINGFLECIPTDPRVSSQIMTAVLARRGLSCISPEDYLMSLDVNLKPYVFQIHPGKTAGVLH